MHPDSRRFRLYLAFFTLYLAVTAVRLFVVGAGGWSRAFDIITPEWVVGQAASAGCMVCIGYIFRADRERRARKRRQKRAQNG